MTDQLIYEVSHIIDKEARLMARFRSLDDARRYVQTHSAPGKWEIALPDGRRFDYPPTPSSRPPHDTLPGELRPDEDRFGDLPRPR